MAGSGRERGEKLRSIAQYFAVEIMQRDGSQQYSAGTGIKGYGKGEICTPLCPAPTFCGRTRRVSWVGTTHAYICSRR